MYRENIHHADLENGYYLNPILDGDYPDPAVFRENDNYYLCVSTENYLPGLTIFHSKDLVNWQWLCSPLKDFELAAWAPDILKYGDKYYIYFSAGGTNYAMVSEYIDKGWSRPVDLKMNYIDPGHVADDDGNRFLFLSKNHVVPLSRDGLQVTGPAKQVLKAPPIPEEWETEGEFPEAPNIFKKDGYYYLTYANGGTAGPATSHMIMSARARDIYGPWELSPYNPVVHTWSREEKWISKGHGHFVEDTEGKWWVIYHAYENGYESLGRKLLLSPVEFTEDGWFQITEKADEPCRKTAGALGNDGKAQTGVGQTIERARLEKVRPSLSDDFSGTSLKSQWTARYEIDWSRYSLGQDAQAGQIGPGEGRLAVRGEGDNPGESRPLTIITGDHSYEVTVKVTKKDTAVKAGLILQYDERIYNGISLERGEVVLYRIGRPLWRVPVDAESIWLKMKNHEQYLSFYYSLDGEKYIKLSPVVNLVSQNTNAYGGFLSLRPGIFACGEGIAEFRDFIYKGIQ